MTFRHRDARRVVTKHEGESMTETHHQEACDVHNILDKYTRTRDASLLARSQPYFADVVDAPDYIAAQEQIANANSLFEELPSDVRAECKNDPAIFLDKMENDEDFAMAVYGESAEALRKLSERETAPGQGLPDPNVAENATETPLSETEVSSGEGSGNPAE